MHSSVFHPFLPFCTVISYTHPSPLPLHTEPLNFSLGLCIQASGLSQLHHGSHYLSVSFSMTRNDRPSLIDTLISLVHHGSLLPSPKLQLSLSLFDFPSPTLTLPFMSCQHASVLYKDKLSCCSFFLPFSCSFPTKSHLNVLS